MGFCRAALAGTTLRPRAARRQARAGLWRGGARDLALLRRVLQLRVPRDPWPARRRRLQGEARALRRVRRAAEPVHGARGARHRQSSARGARARRQNLTARIYKNFMIFLHIS